MKKHDHDDANPGPALQTPRRIATQLEALYLEVARAAGRLQGVAVYLDSPRPRDLAGVLVDVGQSIAELRGRVLAGEVDLVVGRDESSWRDARPLLAAIEARNGAGHGHADGVTGLDGASPPTPAPGKTARPRAKSPRRPVGRSGGPGPGDASSEPGDAGEGTREGRTEEAFDVFHGTVADGRICLGRVTGATRHQALSRAIGKWRNLDPRAMTVEPAADVGEGLS